MYLEDIVDHSHWLPLSIDLGFVSQAEAFDTYVAVAKHGYNCAKSLTIYMSSAGTVDLLLHLFDQLVGPYMAPSRFANKLV